MSSLPPEPAFFIPPGAGRDSRGFAGLAGKHAGVMATRWLAVHDAAAVVAGLAGMAPLSATTSERAYPAVMQEIGGWRLRLAEQGVEDLSIILQTGMAALLEVHARGTSPAAAAGALWEEFTGARDALLALCPPGALERRSIG